MYFANFAKGLILGCACGTGLWRETLKSKGETVGVNVNRKYLKKPLYENAVLCSITNLPFKDKIFDFI